MLELQDCGFKFDRDFNTVLTKYNDSNLPNDAKLKLDNKQLSIATDNRSFDLNTRRILCWR